MTLRPVAVWIETPDVRQEILVEDYRKDGFLEPRILNAFSFVSRNNTIIALISIWCVRLLLKIRSNGNGAEVTKYAPEERSNYAVLSNFYA